VFVSPAVTALRADSLSSAEGGKMNFRITPYIGEDPQRSFIVEALVEEWVEVPVAARPLSAGSVVGPLDVAMARLNIQRLPRDAAFQKETIVGLETKRGIAYGEVFRKNKLSIPPVITAGAKVTLEYRSKFLRATATGIALEDAAVGENIRIRNEASKKIVSGTVLEPGIVGVTP
ncbi:MAG: flagellar basal body P-ring formation protein FlgA, partial [Bdellovibrionales bacterium]|nr:flagellar basal body P-ring formation protein FlgA [Bdellovibrionales bacterium]